MLTKSFITAASFVLGAGILTGCASQTQPATASDTPRAMMCPKCETVWVAKTTGQGTKVQQFTSEKKMVCPECDQMAQSYLQQDGQRVLHNCPTCQVTPTVVTPLQPSHPKGPRSS